MADSDTLLHDVVLERKPMYISESRSRNPDAEQIAGPG
jgi:hypothetical protein